METSVDLMHDESRLTTRLSRNHVGMAPARRPMKSSSDPIRLFARIRGAESGNEVEWLHVRRIIGSTVLLKPFVDRRGVAVDFREVLFNLRASAGLG